MNPSTPFFAHLASGTTAPSPRITPFPASHPNGLSLLILPGGGYSHLAEHEARGYAEFFAARGVTCFTLEYRLAPQGHRHPAMLEDALAGMETLRTRSADWGLRSIGIIGSSAGGHLAAMTMTAWRDVPSPQVLRPDFGILCYPVILTRGDLAHAGSRTNLLGLEASDEQIDAVSPAQRVDASTPPCFLWHTLADTSVPMENSLAYAQALRAHQVPFALHVTPNGRHGLGLNATFPWGEEALRWMKELLPASVT